MMQGFCAQILSIHSELSLVDSERHSRKASHEMTNTISFLAQSHTFLNKYLKSRRENETYGTEKS
jgi:hypothetical protein